MRRIFLLLSIFTTLSFSAIDEYKTDVYFGNGILTEEKDAINNAGILEDAIIEKFGLDYFYKHIGKVDYAYNRTDGAIIDNLESLLQKVDGTGIMSVHRYLEVLALIAGLLTQQAHDADLDIQVTQYKDSIKNGHGVLVVAHSQGNLFAGEAYKKLGLKSKNGWMQNYIEFVSVASPRHEDIKSKTPRINWDNDLVAYIAALNNGFIDNPVRKIAWDALRPLIGLTYREKRPDERYTYKSQVGGLSPKGDWKSTEDYLEFNGLSGILGGLDTNVHAFTFYMGQELREDGKELIYNAHDENSTLLTDKARLKIMSAIGYQLEALKQRPSQWKTKKEIGCICKEKYIAMTHKHDPEKMDILLDDKKVKDFTSVSGGEGKIYAITEQYVKASFGGASIEEISEDNSDLCYVLKNDEAIQVGDIRGSKEPAKPKEGVVEITLTWDKPELDYDLVVEWDAGEVDVKDTGCAMEHFHILSEKKIYPGRYIT